MNIIGNRIHDKSFTVKCDCQSELLEVGIDYYENRLDLIFYGNKSLRHNRSTTYFSTYKPHEFIKVCDDTHKLPEDVSPSYFKNSDGSIIEIYCFDINRLFGIALYENQKMLKREKCSWEILLYEKDFEQFIADLKTLIDLGDNNG